MLATIFANREIKSSSLPWLGLDPDTPAVTLDDLFTDR
jgi:hypothetical protein